MITSHGDNNIHILAQALTLQTAIELILSNKLDSFTHAFSEINEAVNDAMMGNMCSHQDVPLLIADVWL